MSDIEVKQIFQECDGAAKILLTSGDDHALALRVLCAGQIIIIATEDERNDMNFTLLWEEVIKLRKELAVANEIVNRSIPF
jgi:hypothetical protein